MTEWIRGVNPNDPDLYVCGPNGKILPVTPQNVLDYCVSGIDREPWELRAWRDIAPDDGMWFYFSAPHQAVAAYATAKQAPYLHAGRWWLEFSWDERATRALMRRPVPLADLQLTNDQPPRAPQRVESHTLDHLTAHVERYSRLPTLKGRGLGGRPVRGNGQLGLVGAGTTP